MRFFARACPEQRRRGGEFGCGYSGLLFVVCTRGPHPPKIAEGAAASSGIVFNNPRTEMVGQPGVGRGEFAFSESQSTSTGGRTGVSAPKVAVFFPGKHDLPQGMKPRILAHSCRAAESRALSNQTLRLENRGSARHPLFMSSESNSQSKKRVMALSRTHC